MSPASESTSIAVGSKTSSGVGFGFGAREYRPPQNRGQPSTQRNTTSRRGNNLPDKSKLWCSHCGMQKHTKETCFQLVGYPEWWEEEKAGKAKVAIGTNNGGRNQTEGEREATTFQERKTDTGGLLTDGGGRSESSGGGKPAEAMIASFRLDGGETGGYPDGEDYWTWH
ncbi:uncharacterized protein LOC121796097 [Salvia splendens]|uniref:uncharacterized protein LOC121796097 n=1 Tax=Salvia splendens TaxID=180675 RepID=UPI001C25A5CB|nr:uncharacterized protein LOC121796097 [Salvia splendens]